MYATLNILNQEDRNIITVEDPVEYRLNGVNQIQVNPKAGLTFASALRSILRADPDIVLIGEIRDKETATIAIEAALTGHLVLSSLHTNDAPSAISRLVEMEVETFLVASAIDAVVAQRLARKLCERCKESYKPDHAELGEAGFPEWLWPEIAELWRAVGCSACSSTGFRGRAGLYEVMPMSEEIERLTVDRASADEIRRVAVQQGMVTLRDDGLEKARLGLTSSALLEVGGSDLHITAGAPPTVRVHGELEALPNYPLLSPRSLQGMIYAILRSACRPSSRTWLATPGGSSW
jgi:type IV pilus assembly protein PilB